MQIFIIRAFSFDNLKKIFNFEVQNKKRPIRNMEELKKKNSADLNDKEIVFSKPIKAGKRIYYLDVKKNRKDEMFLAITESKKIVNGEGEDAQVSFEKHKIFLYKEDFDKFINGLMEAVDFIKERETPENESDTDEEIENGANGKTVSTSTSQTDEKEIKLDEEIKIDIDFE